MGGLPSESSVGTLSNLSTRHLKSIIILNISTCRDGMQKRARLSTLSTENVITQARSGTKPTGTREEKLVDDGE